MNFSKKTEQEQKNAIRVMRRVQMDHEAEVGNDKTRDEKFEHQKFEKIILCLFIFLQTGHRTSNMDAYVI